MSMQGDRYCPKANCGTRISQGHWQRCPYCPNELECNAGCEYVCLAKLADNNLNKFQIRNKFPICEDKDELIYNMRTGIDLCVAEGLKCFNDPDNLEGTKRWLKVSKLLQKVIKAAQEIPD